jgi:two-component system, LytTR family, sensor kinase
LIKVNDKWLRISILALPSCLFLYNYFKAGNATFQANGIYILTVLIVCEGSRYLIYQSRTWFTQPYKKAKRLLALLPPGIAFVALVFALSKALRNYIAFGNTGLNANQGITLHFENEQVNLGLIGTALLNGTLTFLVLLGIYELAYHFARLQHTERERDRLEKEKLQAELQQLKGIVNPHFLFNNLNSLSSLISENPVQAEAFLDELTKVFRYLLRTNETVLTTVGQELQFMNSYYHLLQTRYGKGIEMQVTVDARFEAYLLPPLTLQLLVENAVKHNRVQKENPLQIDIYSDATNRLIVRNNLSKRENSIESTGIGLRSINSRYKLLGQEGPTIQQEGQFFCVLLPLIPAADASSVMHARIVSNTGAAT